MAKKQTAIPVTVFNNKIVATFENIPNRGLVAHVTIPVDMGRLRYKGGKSAYFTFGAWTEGQRGCRVQGNVFISTKRLRPETLEKASANYKNKNVESEIEEETAEEELF